MQSRRRCGFATPVSCFLTRLGRRTLAHRLPLRSLSLTMASEGLHMSFSELHVTKDSSDRNGKSDVLEEQAVNSDVTISCFTEDIHDTTLHFQIIKLMKQVYVWIGCNTAKFGHLYAAAMTRPNNTVAVTSVLGGTSDNTGSGIARRLVMKTGLNIIVACNIPKDSPMLEATAERKLIEKLRSLGYIRHRPEGMPMT